MKNANLTKKELRKYFVLHVLNRSILRSILFAKLTEKIIEKLYYDDFVVGLE
jgi:hypothetical protein